MTEAGSGWSDRRRLRGIAAELWSGGRGPILVAVALGWLLAIGVRLVFPALIPQIRAEFEFDLTTAGLVLTLLWLGYALAQFPGGFLGDRLGERTVLVVSTLVATAALVVVVLSLRMRWFVTGTVLFGLGTGLFATTRFTVLSDVYPDRGATAIGLSAAAGNLGTAVLPAVAGVIAGVLGWRWGFGLAIPLLAVTAVGLAVVVPRRTGGTGDPGGTTPRPSVRAIIRAVRRPRAFLTTGAMLLMSFIYQGFTSFYPTYLVVEKGLTSGTAAILFGLFFAAGVVIQPLAGGVGDRFGARRTVAVTIVLTVGTLLALPTISGIVALAAISILSSAQLGFWPVVQASLIDALPDAVQGSGFGLLRTIYLVIAASGPVAIGAMADAGLFDEAFLLLAGIAALAGLPSLILPTGHE